MPKNVILGFLSGALVSVLLGGAIAVAAGTGNRPSGPSRDPSVLLAELNRLVATHPIGQLESNVDQIPSELARLEARLSDAAQDGKVAPIAADEVSVAIARMFAEFGREWQVLSAQADAFHAEFVSLLNASASAYGATETPGA